MCRKHADLSKTMVVTGISKFAHAIGEGLGRGDNNQETPGFVENAARQCFPSLFLLLKKKEKDLSFLILVYERRNKEGIL